MGKVGEVFIKVFHIQFSFMWNFPVTETTAVGSFFIKPLFIVIYFYVFGLTFVAFYLNLLLVQSIYTYFLHKELSGLLKKTILISKEEQNFRSCNPGILHRKRSLPQVKLLSQLFSDKKFKTFFALGSHQPIRYGIFPV